MHLHSKVNGWPIQILEVIQASESKKLVQKKFYAFLFQWKLLRSTYILFIHADIGVHICCYLIQDGLLDMQYNSELSHVELIICMAAHPFMFLFDENKRICSPILWRKINL